MNDFTRRLHPPIKMSIEHAKDIYKNRRIVSLASVE